MALARLKPRGAPLPNSRERKKPLPLPAPISPFSPHLKLAVAALETPTKGGPNL